MATTPSRRRTDRKTTEPAAKVTRFPSPIATDQPTAVEPTPSDIARRAFEIYCGRGYEPGHDVEDWLQAEGELRAAVAGQAVTERTPRRRRAADGTSA